MWKCPNCPKVIDVPRKYEAYMIKKHQEICKFGIDKSKFSLDLIQELHADGTCKIIYNGKHKNLESKQNLMIAVTNGNEMIEPNLVMRNYKGEAKE